LEFAARLTPAMLEAVCADYWRGEGPIALVLDRLEFAPLRPPRSMRSASTAVWREPALAVGPDAHLLPEGTGAAWLHRHTEAVASAARLVGPWEGPLALGPFVGTPTVALVTADDVTPHLDLMQRAARALETRFAIVHRETFQLAATIALRAA
jgi:hypothetical protein